MGAVALHRARFAKRHELRQLFQKAPCSDGVLLGMKKEWLVFNRYGDRYFLSRISDDSRGWQLPASAVEKELIAKKASPKPVTVDAGDDQ